MIRMDKYVVFIKRRKERKYKYRRDGRKREFNKTLLQVNKSFEGLKSINPVADTILLANNQPDALFYVFIYFTSLHVSSITVLIIRRSNCINTSSGVISLCK
jgi:hypothetical protein